MYDLILGGALLCALSLFGYRGAFRLGRSAPRSALPWAIVLLLLGVFWFGVAGQDRLFWVRVTPWGGAAVVGLSLLWLAAPLCGLFVAGEGTGGRRERVRVMCAVAVLLAAAAFQALYPFLGSVPATRDAAKVPESGVFLQTSEASCSAASAATLLAAHGVAATESEMATLCLTRSRGTPMLGVYRGLTRKVGGATGRRVVVFAGGDRSALRRAVRERGPILLSVGIDRWQRVPDDRYVRRWGWTPGRRHAVVLFGFLPDGKLDIGDPSVGREKWDEEALSVLWHGEGIQLETVP